jgi:hypothetical protein
MVIDPTELAGRMNVALSARRAKVRAGEPEEGTEFTIRRIDTGKLRLPTGRICVTDAYSADMCPPLNRIVPPGEYPVELVIAELPKNIPFGNDRCAFAVVTFGAEPAGVWEPVTAVEPADPNFTEKRPNGFVQSGGTGLFSPEAAMVHFGNLWEQFEQRMEAIREQAQHYGRNDWVNYRPPDGLANVIICEGGFGDGTYYCFAGLTETGGRVTHLVIDFGIADPLPT